MAGETAAKRERLFKDFSERLVRIRPAAVHTFICPLCERSFMRDALAGTKPQVTLAQVLPDPSWPSLGPRGPVKGAIVRFRTTRTPEHAWYCAKSGICCRRCRSWKGDSECDYLTKKNCGL
jgi:hypothetical protein